MIIDKEQKIVAFNTTDRMIQILELSQAMNELDIDSRFNDFVEDVARRTLRASLRNTSDENDSTYPIHVITSRNIDSNIRRWALRKSGSAYELLVSFFATQDKDGTALRSNMLSYFVKNFRESGPSLAYPAEDRFINRFRLMCTDARGGYGQIFQYEQETDKVTLSKANEELILRYKEEFIL